MNIPTNNNSPMQTAGYINHKPLNTGFMGPQISLEGTKLSKGWTNGLATAQLGMQLVGMVGNAWLAGKDADNQKTIILEQLGVMEHHYDKQEQHCYSTNIYYKQKHS